MERRAVGEADPLTPLAHRVSLAHGGVEDAFQVEGFNRASAAAAATAAAAAAPPSSSSKKGISLPSKLLLFSAGKQKAAAAAKAATCSSSAPAPAPLGEGIRAHRSSFGDEKEGEWTLDAMLTHQTEPIPTSLLKLQGDGPSKAVQMFRSLLRFSGDESNSSSSLPPPPKLGSREEASEALSLFLLPALSRQDLRDELYAQLVKQTRRRETESGGEEKKQNSSLRYWRLLAALSAVAPPSPALLPLVLEYLEEAAGGERKESSPPSRCAAAAASSLRRTSRAGSRALPPTPSEASRLLSLSPLRVRVRLLVPVEGVSSSKEERTERRGGGRGGGKGRERTRTTLSLALAPAATVLEAVEAVADALPLDNYKTFSLFASSSSASPVSSSEKRTESRWRRKKKAGRGGVEGDSDGDGVDLDVEGLSSLSSSSPSSGSPPLPSSDVALDDGAYLADVLCELKQKRKQREAGESERAATAPSSTSSRVGLRSSSSSSSSSSLLPLRRPSKLSEGNEFESDDDGEEEEDDGSSPGRHHLVFKRKMFRDGDAAVEEPAFVRLSFAQARIDYLSGSYPVSFEEAARLAALQAGAEGCLFGGEESDDEDEEEAVASFASALAEGDRSAADDCLGAFLPPSSSIVVDGKAKEASSGGSRKTRDEWRSAVAEAARELLLVPSSSPSPSLPSRSTATAAEVVSRDRARSLFLSRLRSLPYGGCLFFSVRRVQDPVGLFPPGRLSMGINARGLHFFRGGSGGGGGFCESVDVGACSSYYLKSSSPCSSTREYIYTVELRDIMQFGSSSTSVFFKMRVGAGGGGVGGAPLRVFEFETEREGQGDAACLALQTHISDVMSRRFHEERRQRTSPPPSPPAVAPPSSAAAAASAAEKEVEELRKELAAALSEVAAAKKRGGRENKNASSVSPSRDSDDESEQKCVVALEEEIERLRASELRAREEARALRESSTSRAERAEREASSLSSLVEAQASRVAELERAYRSESLARKRAHNEVADLRGKVRVFARVRPLSPMEKEKHSELALSFPDALTLRTSPSSSPSSSTSASAATASPSSKDYFFDAVYPPSATQADVFSDAKSLVASAVDGHNVCVFAYGQTGSGKTHTIYGDLSSFNQKSNFNLSTSASSKKGEHASSSSSSSILLLEDPCDPKSQVGLAPRAAVELFRLIDEGNRDGVFSEAEVSVSMLELYCDELSDLLVPCPPPAQQKMKKLEIKRDPRTGTVAVPGAARRRVSSASELLSTIVSAAAKRRVSATLMNSASSRSHLVVTVHVSTLNRQTGHLCRGKLAFVDLAGSERLKKSGSEGKGLKEAAAINSSLSALGDVISALTTSSSLTTSTSNNNESNSSPSSHVPYRNSKLTMLMADCLGGTAKTVMVVNVAPTDADLQETTSALAWASRARGVLNGVRRDAAGPEVLALRDLLEKWKARAGVPEAQREWVDWVEVEDVRGGGGGVE